MWSEAIQAAHIVGGEVTYECLGEGTQANHHRYQVRMNIYYDCNSQDPIDNAPGSTFQATLTVYQSPNILIGIYEVDSFSAQAVQATGDPCLVPANSCTRQGTYVFPELELEQTNVSYYFVYQRCCRSTSVQNLVEPNKTGGTYFTELTAEAQNNCNSNPRFRQLPPIEVCVGEALDFDFSATDSDGHRLEYSLCTPISGGGHEDKIHLVNTSEGLAPIPAAPPDYLPVGFVMGFNAQQPLGGTAQLRIDSATGRITGQPRVLGQFALAVCVQEYDSQNRLVGSVLHDFQMNIVLCTPLLVAAIDAEPVPELGDNYYSLRSCNGLALKNQSTEREYIEEVSWQFSTPDTTLVSTTWDADIRFPDVGIYEGKLVVGARELCSDTAFIQVEVAPAVEANFQLKYDTCSVSPVVFENLSTEEGANVVRRWEFGDGQESSATNPVHQYDSPDTYSVRLFLENESNCLDSFSQQLEYYPRVQNIDIIPDQVRVCLPDTIRFNNFSEPLSEAYEVRWDFGDGSQIIAIAPAHEYTEQGTYSFSVELLSLTGCRTTKTYGKAIEVLPSLVADFDYVAEELSSSHLEVSFKEQARGATAFFWNFDDGIISTLPNPIHTFSDTGRFQVQLTVENMEGCTDSLARWIDVVPSSEYFLPNAFTPNSDGTNDEFIGKGQLDHLTDFSIYIYDRYGALVFFSDNPREAWDGQRQNRAAPEGIYVYTVQYRTARQEWRRLSGTLTLLR
ncbi:MAG: PKD domain-containing protein [Bacteroidota bacterium]